MLIHRGLEHIRGNERKWLDQDKCRAKLCCLRWVRLNISLPTCYGVQNHLLPAITTRYINSTNILIYNSQPCTTNAQTVFLPPNSLSLPTVQPKFSLIHLLRRVVNTPINPGNINVTPTERRSRMNSPTARITLRQQHNISTPSWCLRILLLGKHHHSARPPLNRRLLTSIKALSERSKQLGNWIRAPRDAHTRSPHATINRNALRGRAFRAEDDPSCGGRGRAFVGQDVAAVEAEVFGGAVGVEDPGRVGLEHCVCFAGARVVGCDGPVLDRGR